MRGVRRSASSEIRLCALIRLLSVSTILSGCSTVGVTSIDQGRTPYNEVIQDTSKQQTLLNIVRVSKGESPLFLDVGEVDQAHTVSGSITGGASSIGARPNPNTAAGTYSGILGALTGTATYQEAPTVRYIPLSGQALIAQVSTPINAEAIAGLLNNNWPLGSVMSLSIDRISRGYLDYDGVIDDLISLDNYGAIIVAATQSPGQQTQSTLKGLQITSAPPQTKDTLTIYFNEDRLAAGQVLCDLSLPKVTPAQETAKAKAVATKLWSRLQHIYHREGANSISLQSKNSPALKESIDKPPELLTRSALGVLRAATSALTHSVGSS